MAIVFDHKTAMHDKSLCLYANVTGDLRNPVRKVTGKGFRIGRHVGKCSVHLPIFDSWSEL